MRLIDAQFLEPPWYGARQMARHLRREGWCVGRKRIRRLMRLMGLQAIYQAPRTSDPHPEHKVYPYLLRGLSIEKSNHAWCADITYIPMRRGFLYLVAIMDWASRTMDGKGRWVDNVFIERLWRSLKYECVYLAAFETGSETRDGIGNWMSYYNTRRPHSFLRRHGTPHEAYAKRWEETAKLAALWSSLPVKL